MRILENPFVATKAVDLTDAEIQRLWVDLPTGGFAELAQPKSQMPMLVIGGKGSGKTHLLRYYSYPLQKLRCSSAIGIREEGYIGVYLRCGGLNASRFQGKSQTDEAWSSVFAYYMDLWLAQLALRTLNEFCLSAGEESSSIQSVLSEVAAAVGLEAPESSEELLGALQSLQAEIDQQVNNAALTRKLDVKIRSNPGKLVFRVPIAFATHCESVRDLTVLYLLDELENLTEWQQQYVNTLIRERERPSTFKIGARHYGVRTFKTLSAGETNKEGSEYELLSLDDRLRASSGFALFARRLVARRLANAGYVSPLVERDAGSLQALDDLFERPLEDRSGGEELGFEVKREAGGLPKHLHRLKRQLESELHHRRTSGVRTQRDIELIVEYLAAIKPMILQKAALHALYSDWAGGRDLQKAAQTAAMNSRLSSEDTSRKWKLQHWRSDFVAQLRRDSDERQVYAGLETFVEMSRGLPRNLLVILKHVFQWAAFRDEEPFTRAPISLAAQRKAVLESSEWFLRDAEVLGERGRAARTLVQRLGELFKEVRYSDKPSECSLVTFSILLDELDPDTRRTVQEAERWSLLVRVPLRQKVKNRRRSEEKFQLNSMLSPLWDLPIARRGVIELSSEEIRALANPESDEAFKRIVAVRIGRMNAPFRTLAQRKEAQQELL